jgi:hypothetical protein
LAILYHSFRTVKLPHHLPFAVPAVAEKSRGMIAVHVWPYLMELRKVDHLVDASEQVVGGDNFVVKII